MSRGGKYSVVIRRDSVDSEMAVLFRKPQVTPLKHIPAANRCVTNRCAHWLYENAVFFTSTHNIIPRVDPAKILSVHTTGSVKSQQSISGVKKITLKQGDPVQMICNVTGYPEPTVQWTKRVSI